MLVLALPGNKCIRPWCTRKHHSNCSCGNAKHISDSALWSSQVYIPYTRTERPYLVVMWTIQTILTQSQIPPSIHQVASRLPQKLQLAPTAKYNKLVHDAPRWPQMNPKKHNITQACPERPNTSPNKHRHDPKTARAWWQDWPRTTGYTCICVCKYVYAYV